MSKDDLQSDIDSIRNRKYDDFCIDFPHDDIIDSRDIEERLVELEDEYIDLLDEWETSEPDDDEWESITNNLKEWISENADEYLACIYCKEQVEGYTSEWSDGVALINSNYFEDYARQLADDIGAIDSNAGWPNNHIDWKEAADELKLDYTEFEIDYQTYYFR